MSRLLLLGDPVEHSLSPLFQNAALEAAGLPWTYKAQQVDAGELAETIESFRSSDVVGANVTIPHKMAASRLVDATDQDAGVTGAVNTIAVQDGQLFGANTDVRGFLTALEESLPEGPVRPGVLVLGAGGAARSVAWALVEGRQADSVTIVTRNAGKGRSLIDSIRGEAGEPEGSSVDWALYRNVMEMTDAELAVVGLVVNATPIGLGTAANQTPLPELERFAEDILVFDLVYGPRKTRLLEEATQLGMRASDGLAMLLHQGARSFELWTGTRAPIEVMRRALYERTSLAKAANKRED